MAPDERGRRGSARSRSEPRRLLALVSRARADGARDHRPARRDAAVRRAAQHRRTLRRAGPRRLRRRCPAADDPRRPGLSDLPASGTRARGPVHQLRHRLELGRHRLRKPDGAAGRRLRAGLVNPATRHRPVRRLRHRRAAAALRRRPRRLRRRRRGASAGQRQHRARLRGGAAVRVGPSAVAQ